VVREPLTPSPLRGAIFSEVADGVRAIARDQGRWCKIASAFPFSPTTTNRRGINKTDWIRIDRATYDACLDPPDYRPRP
jgi:hypothetical protein